jgi:hypothetical protein
VVVVGVIFGVVGEDVGYSEGRFGDILPAEPV